MIQGSQVRDIALGRPASKATGAISGNPTTPLFTIAGGEVMITSVYGLVTTALTNATGTYALQQNPTAGDTTTLVTATALGATDVSVGSTLGLTHGTTVAPAFLGGGQVRLDTVVTTGQIEFVGALSADGAITFNVTWIPLTDGATLVAA